MAAPHSKPQVLGPVLLLATDRLPEGPNWQYEVKLDGYRAIAFKSGGNAHFRSRNNKDFNPSIPGDCEGASAMPDETTIDGCVDRSRLFDSGFTGTEYYKALAVGGYVQIPKAVAR